MRQKRTHGYAERLRRALEKGPRPMSVRTLGEVEIQREPYRHIRGATYAGVRQYVEGKVRNPRIELLKAFAEILGVRFEWLAYGEGPMTEAGVVAERVRGEAYGTDPHLVGLVEKVFPKFYQLDPVVREQVLRLAVRFVDASLRAFEGEEYTEDEAALRLIGGVQSIKDALFAPLDRWGVTPETPGFDFTRYAMAMLLALDMAMPKSPTPPPAVTLARQGMLPPELDEPPAPEAVKVVRKRTRTKKEVNDGEEA